MIFTTANRSFTYLEFLEYAAEEVALNESNPERVTDEKYARFAKLNLQRMRRWSKTFQPNQDVVAKLATAQKQQWWLITEAWCGDSAQNLPVIAALAEAANIDLRIVLRDENPQIIDQYLTNGTKSIPILVGFNMEGNQLFTWGPRPVSAQALMLDWKTNPNGRDFDAFEAEMHTWYTQNKGVETETELSNLV